jgi:hypothetical protein
MLLFLQLVSLVESLLDKLRFIPQLLTLSSGCAASAVFIAPIHLHLVSLVESLLDKLRFIPQLLTLPAGCAASAVFG